MSKLERNDDYTRMKKFIDEMKKKQRKARQRIIKNIGENVIRKFKAPKYETYSRGIHKDEYKLDQNGNKIRKTHHTRSGKTIKDTRKLVSFKDFVNNFKVIPKDADDNSNLLKLNDETISKDQAVKVLNLFEKYYHMANKGNSVSDMITRAKTRIDKAEAQQKAEQDQQQNNDSDKPDQDNNDQNDTGNSDGNNQDINEDPYSHPDNNLNPDNI